MDLNDALVFAQVVQAGSFTAAARQLQMPKSTVSRKVAELEERLAARLLQRTTRKLSLTDVGRAYYEYCARIARELEDAERAVSRLQQKPRGLLRVTAMMNASFLAPILRRYLERYPEVRLDLFCTPRVVDLVEEGYDVGIRAGALADSTLIGRSLGSMRWFLVATEAYLKRHGAPRRPEDLMQHQCLLFNPSNGTPTVRLSRGERQLELTPPTRIAVGDTDILHAAAVAHLGIATLPATRCVEELRNKKLQQVLPEWTSPSSLMHVVYPSTRHLSPTVKSFVEHLHEAMTPPPWERGPGVQP